MAPLVDPPRVVVAAPGLLVAVWRGMAFSVWGREPMTIEVAKRQVDVVEAHGRAVGKSKLIEMAILDEDVSIPNGEVRAVLDQGVPRIGPYYAGVATLFESGGFRAALIRGIMTSFAILGKQKFEQKVFSNRDECIRWTTDLSRKSGMLLRDETELAQAVDAVRARATEIGVLTART